MRRSLTPEYDAGTSSTEGDPPMKVYDAASIRNVALVGHSASGKTQLASAILADAGMINRFGKVDEGTTVTDYDEEEIARKHTLSAEPRLRRVEQAEDQPDRHARRRQLPRRRARGAPRRRRRAGRRRRGRRRHGPDREGVGRGRGDGAAAPGRRQPARSRAREPRADARPSLRESCSRSVIPIQLPIGEEKDFRGVVDLVSKKAFTFTGRRQRRVHRGRRAGGHDGERSTRRARRSIEMVAENDEKLMEHFFEAGTLTDEELVAACAARRSPGKLFPLVCTSALLNIGVPQLLDAIVALPAVAGRSAVHGRRQGRRAEVARTADEKGPLSAFVWKTIADPFAGRITMFRVVSGVLKADSTVHNKTQGRAGAARPPDADAGQDARPTCPEVKAGDLGAVAKLKDTLTNDMLGDKSDPITYPPRHSSRSRCSPTRSSRRAAATRTRSARRCTGCEEEDPSIRYSRDPQTKELLLYGPGTAAHRGDGRQAEAALRRRRQPQAAAHPLPRDDQGARPRRTAATRSRPAATASSATARSRSSRCRAAPTSSSSTTSSAARSRASSFPRWRRASRTRGCAATSPAFRWSTSASRVFDGSYHDVDSNELSFKMAGSPRVQGRDDARAADDPRAGHERRGLRAVGVRRRPDGRSQRPARPHRRHGHARRDHDHQGAGADVRDAHLRAAPDVGDRRPRLVPHGVLALRRGAGAPAVEDHRDREGRAAPGVEVEEV